MADWNWFFSALPQCAAVIVGLGGAFLVSKIVGNETEHKRSTAFAEQLLDESENLQDRLSQRYFRWYNRHSLKDSINSLWHELEHKRGDPAAFLSAAEYYDNGSFSPFIPRHKVVARIEKSLELLREPPPPRRRDFDHLVPYAPGLSMQIEQQLSSSLQQERELIDQLVVEVDHHIRRIKRHHRSLASNPESSQVVSWAIAANLGLFLIGVIYPLSWLPLAGGPVVSLAPADLASAFLSLRGVLLLLFSLTFGASMALFWRTNLRLRSSPELLAKLEVRTARGSYSDYLAILDDNQRASPPEDGTDDDSEGVA